MTHWVYVIELDHRVVKSRKFRDQNPNWESANRFFYVGETAKEPQKRFEQHKAGGRLSVELVRKWGLHVRMSECRRCSGREEGRRLERATALRLRRKGDAAYYN